MAAGTSAKNVPAKGGEGVNRTPFTDAIAKSGGGLQSPAPAQNNKSK